MIIVSNRKLVLKILIPVILFAIVLLSITPVKKLVYPLKYTDSIMKYSDMYDLDPYLIMGIISAESRFENKAYSHKGAMGLMQIKEETAKWCIEHFELEADIADIYVPETNILIGCAYMSYLVEVFDGNTNTAIAAYNAGQGNVKNWLEDKRYSDDEKNLKAIPFDETKDYVKKVNKRYKIYKDLY